MEDRYWQALLAIRDRLDDHAVADFVPAAELLIQQLGGLFDTEYGFVVCARHDPSAPKGDPLSGWRYVHHHAHRKDPEVYAAILADYLRNDGLAADEVNTIVTAPGQPETRAYRFSEPGAFEATKAQTDNLYTRLNQLDQLWGATRVADGAEMWIGVVRMNGEAEFVDQQRDLLVRALKFFRPTLKKWALAFGAFGADKPLTPRERTVLTELLRGRSEAEIADVFGLTRGTVHQVVARIYRKYDVSSRGELVAKWL